MLYMQHLSEPQQFVKCNYTHIIIKEWKLGDVKQFAQGHTVCSQPRLDINFFQNSKCVHFPKEEGRILISCLWIGGRLER